MFFSGLSTKIDEEILSYLPAGYDLKLIKPDVSESDQADLVKDADFIISYRFNPVDSVIRSAKKCKLLDSDNQTKAGNWQGNIDGTNTFEMTGKKVGILGMGNIGKKVAKRVQGFDATVQYFDMYPLEKKVNRELALDHVGLEELFSTSDILSCHSPLTNDTFHIVDESRLRSMKSTSVLINTSRGPIVNEIDLIQALENKIIAGAGLDVFESEPIDPSNKLLKMNNVVSTPHVAGTTWDTWSRRAKFAFENINRVLEGQEPAAVARDFND